MDMSSIKSLFSMPSLSDYMTGGSNAASTDPGSAILNILDSSFTGGDASSDNVDISSLGMQLFAQMNGQAAPATSSPSSSSSSSTAAGTGVQAAATNVLNSFFTDSGIDTSKLGTSAQNLLQGFSDMIASSNTTARDTTTDSMVEKANSNEQVYTLTGDSRRLSIAITYNTDGSPQGMTLTDVNGGQVETANITIGKDSTGAPSSIDINSAQRQYINGRLAGITTADPLSVPLTDAAPPATGS